MSISKNKVRRSFTIEKNLLAYLDQRAKEESRLSGRKVNISTIIEQLAMNDKTIRNTFR